MDEQGIEGHLSIEKERVWDLKSTGQVTTTNRSTAGIGFLCFHPTDPTLCVVTVQGTGSVLSFYNAHSGGKMSTVPLQNVVAAVQFTKDGNQIVLIFRNWSVMTLRPGSPTWSKNLIPFKKETRPAEHLLMGLSPSASPVIFFASSGHQRVNVAFSSMPMAKGSLLSSSQKTSFTAKLTSTGIMGIAGHPDEDDVMLAMLSDGTIQAFAMEQTSMKKLYAVGEAVQSNYGHLGQFEVVPHPLVTGAALILAAALDEVRIYASHGRSHIAPVDKIPLKGMKRICGVGIHKEARVFLVFGEMADGKLTCVGARFTGSETTGLSLVPVNVTFSASATDVMNSNASVSGIGDVSGPGNGSWMELWDAVPAWAQSGSLVGVSRPRIRTVRLHSVMGAIAAQSTASSTGMGPHVILWSINDASHPLGGSRIGSVVPQHTPLSIWSSTTASSEYKLEFPHRCYFMSGNKLSGYGLRSKSTNEIMEFQPPSGRSGPATAETMAFSVHHRTWLIFFRSFSIHPASYGIEEWTYTIQREDEVGASPAWFKPGVSGVFIGPTEDHCCVLDVDLFTVHVFQTKSVSGKDSPLLSLTLPAPGVLTPALFQGPPITQIPKPPPPPEFTSSGNLVEILEDEGNTQVKLGYGVIIWVNRFREIAMGTMISESTGRRAAYEGETVEFIQGGTFSELSEGEIIIQVSWQTLSEESDAQQLPNSFTAAVLTSQRLMIFLANGYPVLSFPPQNSPGLYSPPMSCLWVGPALLYVTRTGEVNQLLWDGSTVMICGAPSTTGSAVLAAALADRILFLCRETESQSWQVATRHAIIGYALLMGWASLASSGLMPPAWVHAHARNQMKIVMQHFDASTVSAPVARALVQSDFADVARVIAQRWPKEAQEIKVACSVAAKNWNEAAEELMHDYQNSVYYPEPIPKGCLMWKRFYAVGLGAVRHGDHELASQLFAVSGEWERALVVLCIAGNMTKLQEILDTAKNQLNRAELDRLQALAEQLKKRAFLSGSIKENVGDGLFEDLGSWTFAAPGYVPPMYCVQGDTPNGMIKEGDIGCIDPLETTDIKGYVSGVSKQTKGGNFMRRTITKRISRRSLLPKAVRESSMTIPEVLEIGGQGSLDFLGSPKTSGTSQGGQKTDPMHGFSDIGFDEKFSSDDDDDEASSSYQFDQGGSAGFGKKFRIQIKKKEDSHSGTSAEALREAAKKLKLGGLSLGTSLGPSGFAAAMKGGGSMHRSESQSSISSSPSQPDVKLSSPSVTPQGHPSDPFTPKPPPSPLPHAIAPVSVGDPFAAMTSSGGTESFEAGVREMEGGNWSGAVEAFSKPGVLQLPRGKQYLAAVLLLKERASMSGSEAARMDRITAAMHLDDKHKKLMTMQAVRENIEVGNYGYAKKRVEWLMESSRDQVSPKVMSALQKQLNECNQSGAEDRDISPFENLDAIPGRIEASLTLEDLKTTVDGLTF